MSKKAGAIPEETRANLISAATEEFRQCGYEKASLRNICKAANVTTGALYFFFQGKEELFSEVLLPITKVVHSMNREFLPILTDNDDSPLEHFVDFYYDNIILYEIIWNNQDNHVVKEYLTETKTVFTQQIMDILNASLPNRNTVGLLDTQTVKWCVDMIFRSVLQLVSLHLDRETAKRHLVTVVKLLRNGVFAIIGIKDSGL